MRSFFATVLLIICSKESQGNTLISKPRLSDISEDSSRRIVEKILDFESQLKTAASLQFNGDSCVAFDNLQGDCAIDLSVFNAHSMSSSVVFDAEVYARLSIDSLVKEIRKNILDPILEKRFLMHLNQEKKLLRSNSCILSPGDNMNSDGSLENHLHHLYKYVPNAKIDLIASSDSIWLSEYLSRSGQSDGSPKIKYVTQSALIIPDSLYIKVVDFNQSRWSEPQRTGFGFISISPSQLSCDCRFLEKISDVLNRYFQPSRSELEEMAYSAWQHSKARLFFENSKVMYKLSPNKILNHSGLIPWRRAHLGELPADIEQELVLWGQEQNTDSAMTFFGNFGVWTFSIRQGVSEKPEDTAQQIERFLSRLKAEHFQKFILSEIPVIETKLNATFPFGNIKEKFLDYLKSNGFENPDRGFEDLKTKWLRKYFKVNYPLDFP